MLSGCAHQQLLDNTTVEQIRSMDCPQLDKQNNYLALKIAQLRAAEIPFASKDEIDSMLHRALERRDAVNETSVEKMCTFG